MTAEGMSYEETHRPTVLILSDRADIASDMAEDVHAAGGRPLPVLTISQANSDPDALRTAHAILVDVDRDDSAIFDLLAHLYDLERVAIVTELAYLETVYIAPNVHIIIGQERAERIVMLARLLRPVRQAGHAPSGSDHSAELQRITAQVALIAQKLAELSGEPDGEEYRPHDAHDSVHGYRTQPAEPGRNLASARVSPRLNADVIRGILRARRMRDDFFDGGLFADPAWDMLLDMTVARLDGDNVSVSSLCIAACVPPTTALRWIKVMTDQGVFERAPDDNDARRVFVALSDTAYAAMEAYVAAVRTKGLLRV